MEGAKPTIAVLRKPVVPGNPRLEPVPRGSDFLNLGSDIMFVFVLIISFKPSLYPTWGSNLQLRDQEWRALPTEPARHPLF